MVTVNGILGEHSGTAEMELKGLSTDDKPMRTFSGYTVGVNSLFFEMDTSKLYYFTGSSWEEIPMNGQSGGGGGSGVTVDTEITENSTNPVTSAAIYAGLAGKQTNDYIVGFEDDEPDKSIAEIWAARQAGRNVKLVIEDSGTELIYPLVFAAETMCLFMAAMYDGDSLQPVFAGWSGLHTDQDAWGEITVSGSFLPAVSGSDNGKVLGVDNGAFALKSVSAVNDFAVTFTETSGTITADKTVAEIVAAKAAGKNVYGVIDGTYLYLSVAVSNLVQFGAVTYDDNGGSPKAHAAAIMGHASGGGDTWDYAEL